MCKKEWVNIQTGRVLNEDDLIKLKDNAMLRHKPELWKTWDFEKNNELGFKIWEMTKGSRNKPFWICLKCNSSYDSSVQNRIRDKGCSYCSGKKINHTNCLANLRKDIASLWHPSKNGSITPNDVGIGTNNKFWWLCKVCDKSYHMAISNHRTDKACPYCRNRKIDGDNSLQIVNPELASQWHPSKNGDLTPYDVSFSASNKVWWVCDIGHEWQAKINSRKNGKVGCPYCSGRYAIVGESDMWTTRPDMASMLLNPEDGYKYKDCSGIGVDWKCPTCYDIICNKKINNVKHKGLRCRKCQDSMSIPEKIMHQLLRLNSIDFEHDKMLSFSKNKRYDFVVRYNNETIIIEVHGRQHYVDTGFSHLGGKTLKEEKDNDEYKENLARINGINKYIVIDARLSDFNYIKNSIIESGLLDLLSINIASFDDIDLSNSLINECYSLYNKGLTKVEISKIVKIHDCTVGRYIRLKEQTGG